MATLSPAETIEAIRQCDAKLFQKVQKACNNLALRLAVMTGKIDADVKTVGPQHQRFEDTLPCPRVHQNERPPTQ